jgi:16S rRNA (guanine527-N7)-methyltransferase
MVSQQGRPPCLPLRLYSMSEQLSLLRVGAAHLGFHLTERQLAQFQLYYETLVDWNSRVNLTAITDYEGVQIRHFLDSLTVGVALLDYVQNPKSEGFSLLDIGTGAGFPGVPLNILWPHIRLTLVDSVGKKTAFLQALVSVLGLEDVTILTARAEELGQDKAAHRERYDAVAARAVAALPVLCEYCLPLAKVDGLMLAPKKGDIGEELEGAKRASTVLGGGEPTLHTFRLPGEDEERYVVTIKKVKPTPAGYPRRVGLAKSKPLS